MTETSIRTLSCSVQNEFTQGWRTLSDYVHDDTLVRRVFDIFLFEDAPDGGRRRDQYYLEEVGWSEINLGLFGREYGSEDREGASPTEPEFDRATMVGSHRLVFVKAVGDDARHPKMDSLISTAQSGLIRVRFNTAAELISGVYAALQTAAEYAGRMRSFKQDLNRLLHEELLEMTVLDRPRDRQRSFPSAKRPRVRSIE